MKDKKLTGNHLWKLRTGFNKGKLFADAKVLWEEACKYFDWCDRHPRNRVELVKYRGDHSEAEIPLRRMYSMYGLTCYLNVSISYFRTTKAQIKSRIEDGRAVQCETDMLETIERIERVIQAEQIEGAAVGQYANNIVNRLNGLSDNVKVQTEQPTVKLILRDTEAGDFMKELEELL